ncbi:MAG: hypothetical protein NTW83_02760 [Cyanobacteria bacterium]|nr:hypothetical protein [Cyanobacteriota bacterium]
MYLLDTNVVSELRKPRPHGTVLAWLDGVDDANLHLARVNHLTVVNRNGADFKTFEVPHLNPFETGR